MSPMKKIINRMSVWTCLPGFIYIPAGVSSSIVMAPRRTGNVLNLGSSTKTAGLTAAPPQDKPQKLEL